MRMPLLPRLPALALIGLTLLLSGCAANKPATSASAATPEPGGVQVSRQSRGLFGLIKPYRIDIQQGNFVSREMVAQLRTGMTRDQVRFVLGTPLLTDIFHANRWDYEFRLAKGNGDLMSSRVSVFFKDDLLDRYEGGEALPTEQEYLSLITGSKQGAKPELSNSTTVSPNLTNQ